MELLIFKLKSGIKIKPSHKGLFTEYCGGKVTDECIRRGKASKDPKIRKRATFAGNARKWKHLNGGTLYKLNADTKDVKSTTLRPESPTSLERWNRNISLINGDTTYYYSYPKWFKMGEYASSSDKDRTKYLLMQKEFNNLESQATPVYSKFKIDLNWLKNKIMNVRANTTSGNMYYGLY